MPTGEQKYETTIHTGAHSDTGAPPSFTNDSIARGQNIPAGSSADLEVSTPTQPAGSWFSLGAEWSFMIYNGNTKTYLNSSVPDVQKSWLDHLIPMIKARGEVNYNVQVDLPKRLINVALDGVYEIHAEATEGDIDLGSVKGNYKVNYGSVLFMVHLAVSNGGEGFLPRIERDISIQIDANACMHLEYNGEIALSYLRVKPVFDVSWGLSPSSEGLAGEVLNKIPYLSEVLSRRDVDRLPVDICIRDGIFVQARVKGVDIDIGLKIYADQDEVRSHYAKLFAGTDKIQKELNDPNTSASYKRELLELHESELWARQILEYIFPEAFSASEEKHVSFALTPENGMPSQPAVGNSSNLLLSHSLLPEGAKSEAPFSSKKKQLIIQALICSQFLCRQVQHC